ncbi:MAG: hypothetical protein Q9217_005334 [Psora testacea]
MAFHQSTLASTARQHIAPVPEQHIATTIPKTAQRIDDEREWILFPRAESANYTNTASTERTTRTAGLSRLSDFGSLDTAARFSQGELAYQATIGSQQEDAELDGLDEGLCAFQESPIKQASGYLGPSRSVLPSHDGLGTFPAVSPGAQDQFWNFEQYNPRKRTIAEHEGRISSVQRKVDAVEDHDSTKVNDEKRERIERWRLEHSKILLDEIEKQTRRRQSTADGPGAASSFTTAASIGDSQKTIGDPEGSKVSTPAHEPTRPPVDYSETFLQRLTRRVIRDFIGIDEATLSIIFGEALPGEDKGERHSNQSPFVPAEFDQMENQLPWESRLLNRLSRELGFLLGHLSDHPGAFSSPSLPNPSISDYAGIPMTQPTFSRTQPQRRVPKDPSLSSPTFDFHSTTPRQEHPPSPSAAEAAEAESHHASLWGIEQEPSTAIQEGSEREYWEQPADIKTVFRFLHDRFTSSRRPSASSTKNTTPLNIATTSTPDSLRRAAAVRQYHPLVSRAAVQWEKRHGRRSWLHSRYGYAGSSCGSQSLRRSRRGTTTSIGSSSRNFWDIGGSATGSTAGGLGGWGEV